MTPNHEVRRVIGGIVARYQELLNIEIYAYAFLSNHPHFIIRAPQQNTDEFMENVNREISRRMNFRLKRRGKFWERRYADQQILSEEDLLEAFLYVTTNPTRHGLVKDTREWKGLHCYEHALNERDREFSFYHYSAKKEEDRVTVHKLKLSVLPMFQKLSKKQRRKHLSNLLEERMEQIQQGRYTDGGGFIGMDLAENQEPEDVPRRISRSPMPPCYTKSPELRREYRQWNRHRREAYREASIRYRLGDLHVEFPKFTFKPPLHRKPRLERFKPLTPEFLKNF